MPLYSTIRGTCDVKGMSFNARGYGMQNICTKVFVSTSIDIRGNIATNWHFVTLTAKILSKFIQFFRLHAVHLKNVHYEDSMIIT